MPNPPNGLNCAKLSRDILRRFDCPAFPLLPSRPGQPKRLAREHLHGYRLFFPSALTLAHLARAAAASLALTAGLLRRSFFLGGLGVALVPFNFANRIFRARARALISLRLWAAVM